jgi:hypothetical protein
MLLVVFDGVRLLIELSPQRDGSSQNLIYAADSPSVNHQIIVLIQQFVPEGDHM